MHESNWYVNIQIWIHDPADVANYYRLGDAAVADGANDGTGDAADDTSADDDYHSDSSWHHSFLSINIVPFEFVPPNPVLDSLLQDEVFIDGEGTP